ncbi:hypothetical protein P7C70_g8574, partial [Phenoliferia sp. Uapishka_3]
MAPLTSADFVSAIPEAINNSPPSPAPSGVSPLLGRVKLVSVFVKIGSRDTICLVLPDSSKFSVILPRLHKRCAYTAHSGATLKISGRLNGAPPLSFVAHSDSPLTFEFPLNVTLAQLAIGANSQLTFGVRAPAGARRKSSDSTVDSGGSSSMGPTLVPSAVQLPPTSPPSVADGSAIPSTLAPSTSAGHAESANASDTSEDSENEIKPCELSEPCCGTKRRPIKWGTRQKHRCRRAASDVEVRGLFTGSMPVERAPSPPTSSSAPTSSSPNWTPEEGEGREGYDVPVVVDGTASGDEADVSENGSQWSDRSDSECMTDYDYGGTSTSDDFWDGYEHEANPERQDADVHTSEARGAAINVEGWDSDLGNLSTSSGSRELEADTGVEERLEFINSFPVASPESSDAELEPSNEVVVEMDPVKELESDEGEPDPDVLESLAKLKVSADADRRLPSWMVSQSAAARQDDPDQPMADSPTTRRIKRRLGKKYEDPPPPPATEQELRRRSTLYWGIRLSPLYTLREPPGPQDHELRDSRAQDHELPDSPAKVEGSALRLRGGADTDDEDDRAGGGGG